VVEPKTESELPEIPLDDVLDEGAQPPPDANDGLDIDVDSDPLAGPASEPAQPEPSSRAPVSVGLDVDLDITGPSPAAPVPPQERTPMPAAAADLALDELLAPAPASLSAPKPTAAPSHAPEPAPAHAIKSAATTMPRPPTTITSTLDIDALLSDLELPTRKPPFGDGETLTEASPAPAPTAEPAPLAPTLELDDLTVATDDADASGAAPNLRIDTQAPDDLAGTAELELETPVESSLPPSNDVLAANLMAAPPLPLLENEPPPRPAISPSELPSTEEAIETLKKLAGPGFDPEGTRIALTAALAGEPYDLHTLPDQRVMLMGLLRVVIANGINRDDLVDAIMAALDG